MNLTMNKKFVLMGLNKLHFLTLQCDYAVCTRDKNSHGQVINICLSYLQNMVKLLVYVQERKKQNWMLFACV